MKYVNIVYDDEYNDCDIISVPDDLLCDLEKQKPVVSIINMHVDFCDKFPKIEL